MNVVITLPKDLITAIMEGRKKIEARKVFPKHLRLGEDGFFCVEKGTKNVLCWCRVDIFLELKEPCDSFWGKYGIYLAISREWFESYMNGGSVKLWGIGQVKKFEKPLSLDKDLFVDRAPQSFAYTPLSHGAFY